MKWPSAEEQLLANCARLHFDERYRELARDLCRQNPIDWEQVYSTARRHSVAPLVYLNLAQIDHADLGMKNGTVERFRRSFARNLVAKQRMREGLWQILGFFNKRGVDVMLVKGAAMNLFGNGSGPYTVSLDADLIVRARAEDLSDDLLAQISGVSKGFSLEYDFYGHHDVDMNGVLPFDWDRVWSDAIPVHYAGRDFFIMSPEDALITACVNACRKRYFNLKALCAIDARLRDGTALLWDELAEKGHAYQVNGIVYAALVVVERVMGSPVPEDLADRLGTTDARAAIVSLLSRNLSFSSLSSLYSGASVAHRKLGASLLLPYASYRADQVLRKLRHAVSI